MKNKKKLGAMAAGTSITAVLATSALLLPASPAQAMPSEGSCAHLSSMIDLALANNDVWYAMELQEQYWSLGC